MKINVSVTDPVIKPVVYPAQNELTAYPSDGTEVDASSTIAINNTTVTLASHNENDTSYVSEDFGANYFAGDFTCTCKLNMSVQDDSAGVYSMFLGSAVGTSWTLIGGGNPYVGFALTSDGSQMQALIQEYDGSAVYNSSNINLNQSTDYWAKFYRDESVGTNGKLYIRIYSDNFLTQVDATEISLNSKEDYRYFYYLNNVGAVGANKQFTGTFSDFRYWRGV